MEKKEGDFLKAFMIVSGIIITIGGAVLLIATPLAGVVFIIMGVALIVGSRHKFKRHDGFKVAGLSYYWENYRDVIDPEGELNVELVPEPDNKHDPNAIKVIMNGQHIGYVPKEKTADVKKILPDAYEIDAHVVLDGDFWEDVVILIWYRK